MIKYVAVSSILLLIFGILIASPQAINATHASQLPTFAAGCGSYGSCDSCAEAAGCGWCTDASGAGSCQVGASVPPAGCVGWALLFTQCPSTTTITSTSSTSTSSTSTSITTTGTSTSTSSTSSTSTTYTSTSPTTTICSLWILWVCAGGPTSTSSSSSTSTILQCTKAGCGGGAQSIGGTTPISCNGGQGVIVVGVCVSIGSACTINSLPGLWGPDGRCDQAGSTCTNTDGSTGILSTLGCLQIGASCDNGNGQISPNGNCAYADGTSCITADGAKGIYDQNNDCIEIGAECTPYKPSGANYPSSGVMTLEGCSGIECQNGAGIVNEQGVCVTPGSTCLDGAGYDGTWGPWGTCQAFGSSCVIVGQDGKTTAGITTVDGCGQVGDACYAYDSSGDESGSVGTITQSGLCTGSACTSGGVSGVTTLSGCQQIGSECTAANGAAGVVSGVYSATKTIGVGDCVESGTSCYVPGTGAVGVISGDPATSGACVATGAICSLSDTNSGTDITGVINGATGTCVAIGSACHDSATGVDGTVSGLAGYTGQCLPDNACLDGGFLGFQNSAGECISQGNSCDLPGSAPGSALGVTNNQGVCVPYGSSCNVDVPSFSTPETGVVSSADGIAGQCVLLGTPCLVDGNNANPYIGNPGSYAGIAPTGVIGTDGSCQSFGTACLLPSQAAGEQPAGVVSPTTGQCAEINSACCLPGAVCTSNLNEVGKISGDEDSYGQCVPTYQCELPASTPGTILNGNCVALGSDCQPTGVPAGYAGYAIDGSCISSGSSCSASCSSDATSSDYDPLCDSVTDTRPGIVTAVQAQPAAGTASYTCDAVGSSCTITNAIDHTTQDGILSGVTTSSGPAGTCVAENTGCTTTDSLSGIISSSGTTCVAIGSTCQAEDDLGGTVYGTAGPEGCEIPPGSSCYTKAGTPGLVGQGQICYAEGTEGAPCTDDSNDGGQLSGFIDSDGNCGIPYGSSCITSDATPGVSDGANCLPRGSVGSACTSTDSNGGTVSGVLDADGTCTIQPGLVCTTKDGSDGTVNNANQCEAIPACNVEASGQQCTCSDGTIVSSSSDCPPSCDAAASGQECTCSDGTTVSDPSICSSTTTCDDGNVAPSTGCVTCPDGSTASSLSNCATTTCDDGNVAPSTGCVTCDDGSTASSLDNCPSTGSGGTGGGGGNSCGGFDYCDPFSPCFDIGSCFSCDIVGSCPPNP